MAVLAVIGIFVCCAGHRFLKIGECLSAVILYNWSFYTIGHFGHLMELVVLFNWSFCGIGHFAQLVIL